MFTIKFYGNEGYRVVIKEAESFTILRGSDGTAEITLHQKSGEDSRIDIADEAGRMDHWPPRFGKAIIENSAGKTTEIIVLRPILLPPVSDFVNNVTETLRNIEDVRRAGVS